MYEYKKNKSMYYKLVQTEVFKRVFRAGVWATEDPAPANMLRLNCDKPMIFVLLLAFSPPPASHERIVDLVLLELPLLR